MAARRPFRLLECKSPRKPPMPPKPPKGYCKWCEGIIAWGPAHQSKAGQPNLRRMWHAPCARDYRIASFSHDQRMAIRRRGDTKCADCQKPIFRLVVGHSGRSALHYILGMDWDADHIRPLWSAPLRMTYAERLAWFGVDNLQMLCTPCHKEKSKLEAAARARMKRV